MGVFCAAKARAGLATPTFAETTPHSFHHVPCMVGANVYSTHATPCISITYYIHSANNLPFDELVLPGNAAELGLAVQSSHKKILARTMSMCNYDVICLLEHAE